MNKKVGKFVAIGVAALAAVALALVVVFGLGGKNNGSGGASSKTVPSVADSQTANDDSTTSDGKADNAEGEKTGSSSTEDDSYESLKEQLLAEIDAHSAPVGSNARDASQEQGVLSVAELSQQLESRGFPAMDIIAPFNMEGTYLGETVLDPSSTERYPSYQVSYQSTQGVYWVIVVNGSAYLAVPLAADDVSLQKQIILSETDVVVQYDGSKGQYSEFGFDELGDAVGIKVSSVDRATLESYTAQQLREM